ncbi:gamma-glutamyltransferase 1 [Novosphingobium kunmingense]|uniref:Glutathione hydrolase proenzyme n=1 Tax=Novosphingobium kunmingense TaxID=1211806 RepID=A0A2N0H4X3_9SPHN|nr:gamma-glutamyltransferase [Novosphingobium kunmingense]PKB13975.1 gamma-glutamyltransferase 1 [Novosphingobium kunmingense]
MTLRIRLALLALPAFGIAAASPALARQPAPTVYAKGMVSAADPRAADAGAQMLRAGGNATDAAIATMLALSVVEPQSSGIGGGGFFVETGPDGRVATIDGREKAPAAASGKWFVRGGKVMSFADAVPGAISVGVPGNIALAAKAHKAHGKLPWARLFAPAIRLARQGFEITPRFHAALTNSAATAAFTPAGKALFYDAAGLPKQVGTRVTNPAMAATLSAIAAQGAKAFYAGGNARALAAAVTTATRNPAPMTEADVAAYVAADREPVCGNYRTYRICGMGPPSSGATTVFATLKQLERFDLTGLGKDSPVAWHLIAESMRLAYADRARYSGDADFVRVPVAGLTDPDYLAQRSALISAERAMPSVSAGVPRGAESLALADPAPQEEHGTSHFVAIDRRGNVVSYTSTIESAFGSGLMVGGYYLNNELTDFDMNPVFDGKPANNRVDGGKRPRSSMSPSVVFGPDGKVRLAVGAAGGATIPAQVIRAVIGVIDWNLSAQDALALPVIFAPGGNAVYVEKGSSAEALIPALTALGHASVTPRGLPLKANAIEVVDGALRGAADPRSEGKAVSE